jgi:NADH-quinone oxidoreductase subunit L
MLITAGLTAYYTFRMFFLCFHGKLRLPDEAGEHPHDAPAVMFIPLCVLAAGAVFAGYLGVTLGGGSDAFLGVFRPHGVIHAYLGHSTIGHPEHGGGSMVLMYVSALVALAGIALAWLRYGSAPQTDPDQQTLGRLWNLWHAKYYVDEIYGRVFVQPLHRLGRFFFATDNNFVDGVIWLVTAVPRSLAFGLHFLQRGALQAYALSMVIGVAALLLLWSWIGTG